MADPREARYPPGTWEPFSTDASTRRYFRGVWKERPALLADFGDDLDGKRRFLAVTGHFRSGGVRVPEIHAAPEGASWIVQELVDGRPLSMDPSPPPDESAPLEIVSAIQRLGPWEDGPELLELDFARLRFELSFFRGHFLESYCNHVPKVGLKKDLEALAASVSGQETALCHRDFHSENLLLSTTGELVVIDHQDALLGPATYDAASLAVDAYRPFDPGRYGRVCRRWRALRPCEEADFHRAALQRALKALGTFGYQITRRKKVRYLRSVDVTARYALMLLGEGPPGLAILEEPLREVLA